MAEEDTEDLSGYFGQVRAQRGQETHNAIVDSADADKKRAAKASEISNTTGADPNVVYHDFDNVSKDIRNGMVSDIVKGNSVLTDYVNDHPLAAKVSKDDWGNLSKFLDTFKTAPNIGPLNALVKTDPVRDIYNSVIEEAKQTFGTQPVGAPGEEVEKIPGTAKGAGRYFEKTGQLPGVTPLFNPLNLITLLDLSGRVVSGGFGGVAGFFGSLAEKAGVSPGGVLDIEHTIKEGGELIQTFLPSLVGHKLGPVRTPKPPELLKVESEIAKEWNELKDTINRTTPYVKAGEQPPVGLDPAIDKMIAEDSRQSLKELKDQEKAADGTETKELDPEMFERLVSKATKENMAVEWDGVKALYGDKVPEAGDGLLGDVPGIEEQFKNSSVSGEDIQIPKSHWLSKVDRKVSEELGDFVKARPELLSKREIEAAPEAQPIPVKEGASKWQDAVDGARRAAGLEPLLKTRMEAPVKFSKKEREELTRYVDDQAGDPKVIASMVSRSNLGKETIVYRGHDGPDPMVGYQKGFVSASTESEVAKESGKTVSKIIVDANAPALETAKHTTTDLHAEEAEILLGKGTLVPTAEPNTYRFSPLKAPAAKTTQLELDVTRQEDIPIFEPGAIMPKRLYERYMNLWNKLTKADADKDLAEAVREERKKQTPEWNENFIKEREKVVEDIQNTRMFRVSDFFRNGKYAGEETAAKPKLLTSALTPEQQAAIPARFQAKNGIHPDTIAGPMGYQSGAQMLDEMMAFEEMRQGQGPKDFFNRVVKKETDRRMELKYGKFDENILNAAREHVISPTAFDLVHQEVMALAMKLGQAMPMSKEDLRAQAALRFRDSIASQQDLIKYTRLLGKAGREAEAAFLKGDIGEAFKQKQMQVQHMAVAELAKKFQKEQRLWDRNLKTFSKAEVGSVEQEYLNWIQAIYYRVGEKPKRALPDIEENIAGRDYKNFEDFANAKNKEHLPAGFEDYEVEYNPVIPYPEFAFQPDFNKTMDKVTVGEFREINNTVQALAKRGRGERKVRLEGREVDRLDRLRELTDRLDHFADKPIEKWDKASFINTMKVGLMQPEAFFRILDGGDPEGVFTRTFVHPIFGAGNYHDALRRTFSRRIRELDKWKADLDEKLPNNVFYDPRGLKDGEIPPTGKDWVPMTRESLRTVLLNYGNDSNLDILARGYKVGKDDIKNWVNTHATEADFKWAQAVGKIFSDIQRMEDTMTKGMNGSVIEKIPLGKVQTQFGDMDGWYYPVVYDRLKGAGPKGELQPQPKIRISTPHGWTNVRTGYAGPIDLSMKTMSDSIDRRLRHIAFNPVITETSKLLLDNELKNAITKKFGPHYTALLEPWLRDIVGQNNFTPAATGAARAATDFIRVNTIGALIGWNPGTIAKHSASAFAQSWREVGTQAFVTAMRDLYATNKETANSNNKFLMEGGKVGNIDWTGSEELQRRRQHWEETLGGAYELAVDPSKYQRLRQKSIEIGAAPIGIVDQWISKVTYLAKYTEANKEGLADGMTIEEAHTRADALASRAVRNTHGSTMIAARPEFMRLQGALPKTLTSLYGFFNHIFNRYLTMSSRAAETYRGAKRGEPVGAQVRELTTDFMWYVVFPTAVEQVIDQTFSPKDSWAVSAAKFLGQGLMAPIPVVREIVHAIISGHDPAFGMLSQSYKAVTDTVRDFKHLGDKHHTGNAIEHFSTLSSVATGVGSKQVGRWAKYGFNLAADVDHLPRGSPLNMAAEAYRVLRFGSTKKPKGAH